MENVECPQCGTPLGSDMTVCKECGQEIAAPERTTALEEVRSSRNIYGILAVFLAVVGGAAVIFFTGIIPNPFKDRSTAAIVNGEKISAMEVDQKVEVYKKMYAKTGQMDFSSLEGKKALADVKRQVLNSMIQEKILLTEASKENITVSKQEIADKIAAVKKAMNLSDQDFDAFLRNHGMDMTTFEKRMEREAMINNLLAKGIQEKGLSREEWLKELNARAKVEVLAN